MCGISGYLSNKQLDHRNILSNMGDSIEHRGPDAFGIWFDENSGIGLSHRRLAILDLTPTGSQPMESKQGRYVIVFNGEIYNYLELKKELSEFGNISWKGTSDTEIILYGFEIWGVERTINKLIGMFAIALWDKINKELILIRDRIGEKPLYYGWQGSTFIFGSELKPFHKHPDFKKEISLDALGDYFKYNYVPSGKCIFNGIQKLEPGNYCKVSLRNPEIIKKAYWNLSKNSLNQETDLSHKNESSINRLDILLTDAIGKQMVSDVPLGAFLSGGVDSSTIVALMQKQSNRAVKTFSIGFNEEGYDEAVYAKKVAKHIGTDHTEMYVSPSETRNVIPLLPHIYDEPFSDSSQIPTFLVSKLAKTQVTVSLSGDAGDELFGGYNRYLMVNNAWNKLSILPKTVRKSLGQFLLKNDVESLNKFYNKYEKFIPLKFRFSNFGDKMHKIALLLDSTTSSELYDGFISHWDTNEILRTKQVSKIYNLDDLEGLSFIEQMMLVDAKTYLPDDILVKVDRAAMANSLETRVPFLDHRVVEFALSLPLNLKIRNGKGKWILREVLYKYVPKELIERPKMGFGIPLDSWLRGPLKDWAKDLLSYQNLDKHGLLNNEIIHKKLDEHFSGNKNWHYHIWDVLMFQAWYNKYF